MRVFISWSGDRSNQIAEALHRWMPRVIQKLQPYISSNDIAKGARWMQDLGSQLEGIDFGVACLVPENLEAAWIQFEAGALSKSLKKGQVAPILCGVQQSQLAENPLVQFQCTEFSKADMLKLMESINESGSEPAISKEILHEAFAQSWSTLEQDVKRVLAQGPQAKKTDPSQAKQEKVFEELTVLAREQGKSLQKLSEQVSGLLPADVQTADILTIHSFAGSLQEFCHQARALLIKLGNPERVKDEDYWEWLQGHLKKLDESLTRLEAAAQATLTGGGTIRAMRTALVELRRSIAVLEAR